MSEFLDKIRLWFIDFLFTDYVKYALISIGILFVILMVASIIKISRFSINKKKKYKNILQIDNDLLKRTIEFEENVKRKNGIAKKENFIKRLYKEYTFYGGNLKKLILLAVLGYFACLLIIFLISNDVLCSIILSIVWFTILYVFIDNKNSKARKKFIKGFAQALRTLEASTNSSNSFETSIQAITAREGINPKVKDEFGQISAGLKNNKSLEQVMEEFWIRNSSIPEFAMFAIVMQFFSKSGGSGLNKILQQLEASLNQKIINYDKVDAELGINKVLMNIFVYGYVLALVIVPVFYTTFYAGITDAGAMGYIKAIASVAMHLFSVVFYKSMIRSCSEGA